MSIPLESRRMRFDGKSTPLIEMLTEESKRELESEGRRYGSDRGSLGVYIWAGRAPGRR
jgi:hypothetical protein